MRIMRVFKKEWEMNGSMISKIWTDKLILGDFLSTLVFLILFLLKHQFTKTFLYKYITVESMPEYRFSLTRFFLYKDRIYDFVLIRENTDQRKLVFWYNLRSVCPSAYYTYQKIWRKWSRFSVIICLRCYCMLGKMLRK